MAGGKFFSIKSSSGCLCLFSLPFFAFLVSEGTVHEIDPKFKEKGLKASCPVPAARPF